MSRVMDQASLTPLGKQNSLTPQGNNNWNFLLERDRVVHLKSSANWLCHLASNFFSSIFESRGLTKTLDD